MQQDPQNGSMLVPLKAGKDTHQLRKLRITDIVRIKNRITQERREKILANADATVGRDLEVVLKQLHEHDSRPVDRGSVVEWALNPDGILPTLALSWVRSKGKPPQTEEEREVLLKRAETEIDELDADWNDLIDATAGVLNVKLDREEKAPPQKPQSQGASRPLQVGADVRGLSSASPTETTAAMPVA